MGLSGCSSVISREHLYIWSNYFPKRLFQFTSLWVLSTQFPTCVLGCLRGCWEFLKGVLSGTYFSAQAMGSNCLRWEPQPCPQLAWWSWASYAVCPNILSSKGILTSGWCKSSVRHVCEVLSFSLVIKAFWDSLENCLAICNKELMKQTDRKKIMVANLIGAKVLNLICVLGPFRLLYNKILVDWLPYRQKFISHFWRQKAWVRVQSRKSPLLGHRLLVFSHGRRGMLALWSTNAIYEGSALMI